MNLCLSSEENAKAKLDGVRSSVSLNQKSIKEKSETLAQLKERIPTTEKAVKNARAELANVKEEQAKLIPNLQRNRISLEEARSSMQASHSRNKIVDALMNEKKKGNCPGVFGRLVRITEQNLKIFFLWRIYILRLNKAFLRKVLLG